jgi:hypothetical protein
MHLAACAAASEEDCDWDGDVAVGSTAFVVATAVGCVIATSPSGSRFRPHAPYLQVAGSLAWMQRLMAASLGIGWDVASLTAPSHAEEVVVGIGRDASEGNGPPAEGCV